MTHCLAPQSASRAAPSRKAENARFAVSLGAAFALLCVVVLDTPSSFAAGGLFEMLFGGGGGGGGGYYVQPMPGPSYGGGYSRSYGRHRHARRGYAHYARAHRYDRRTVAERRDRRGAENRRVADARAIERHHISTAMRRPQANKNFGALPLPPTRDFIATATPIERMADTQRATIIDRKPQPAPIETVSFTEVANSAATPTNHRAVCVRACDGYYFPIAAKASESAAQESCERLCPGSETRAFLLPSGSTTIDEAVDARRGETYAQFVARLAPEAARAKSCGCPQTAGNLSETSAFMSDMTLRPGDTVVTQQGVRVVRRGSHYPFKKSDFLSLAQTHALPRATRGALFAIDRALKTPYGRLAVANNSERRRARLNADL